MMKREDLIKKLNTHRDILEQFKVKDLYLIEVMLHKPNKKQTLEYIAKSKKVFQWLIDQL